MCFLACILGFLPYNLLIFPGMYDDTKNEKTTKVSVYTFPTKDDLPEKRAWVNALPNMLSR